MAPQIAQPATQPRRLNVRIRQGYKLQASPDRSRGARGGRRRDAIGRRRPKSGYRRRSARRVVSTRRKRMWTPANAPQQIDTRDVFQRPPRRPYDCRGLALTPAPQRGPERPLLRWRSLVSQLVAAPCAPSMFLTVDEVAELLRTSPKAIYAMTERALLPGVTRLGRRLLIRRDDLFAWLDDRRAASPARTPHHWVRS